MNKTTDTPQGKDGVSRDWPEDFSHENGNYNCECYLCHKIFVGHKRRVVCKVCSATPPAPAPGSVSQSALDAAQAIRVQRRDAEDHAFNWHPEDALPIIQKAIATETFDLQDELQLAEGKIEGLTAEMATMRKEISILEEAKASYKKLSEIGLGWEEAAKRLQADLAAANGLNVRLRNAILYWQGRDYLHPQSQSPEANFYNVLNDTAALGGFVAVEKGSLDLCADTPNLIIARKLYHEWQEQMTALRELVAKHVEYEAWLAKIESSRASIGFTHPHLAYTADEVKPGIKFRFEIETLKKKAGL